MREKAVEEARVDGAAMLAQLLEDMPVMQMLAYALHSDSDDTKDSGGHSSQVTHIQHSLPQLYNYTAEY